MPLFLGVSFKKRRHTYEQELYKNDCTTAFSGIDRTKT